MAATPRSDLPSRSYGHFWSGSYVHIPLTGQSVEIIAVSVPVLALLLLVTWYLHAVSVLYVHSPLMYCVFEGITVDMQSLQWKEKPKLGAVRSKAARMVVGWVSELFQAQAQATSETQVRLSATAGDHDIYLDAGCGHASRGHRTPQRGNDAATADASGGRNSGSRRRRSALLSPGSVSSIGEATTVARARTHGVMGGLSMNVVLANATIFANQVSEDFQRVFTGEQKFEFRANVKVQMRNLSSTELRLGRCIIVGT